jgi:hypothetical protein
MKNLEVFQIKVNSYDEEDLLLISDAPADAIERVLAPMVNDERVNDAWYDHNDYITALQTALPQFHVQYIPEPYLIEL